MIAEQDLQTHAERIRDVMARTYEAAFRQYADAVWIGDDAGVVTAAETLSDAALELESLWELLLSGDLEPVAEALVAEHARTMATLSNGWHVVATAHRSSPAPPA